MSPSTAYEKKLERFRAVRTGIDSRRAAARKRAKIARSQRARLKRRNAERKARLYAVIRRIQRYRCGVCRRHMTECGKAGLLPDYFAHRMLRGFACRVCKIYIGRMKGDPELISKDESKPSRYRSQAAAYLTDWPSRRA